MENVKSYVTQVIVTEYDYHDYAKNEKFHVIMISDATGKKLFENKVKIEESKQQ